MKECHGCFVSSGTQINNNPEVPCPQNSKTHDLRLNARCQAKLTLTWQTEGRFMTMSDRKNIFIYIFQ